MPTCFARFRPLALCLALCAAGAAVAPPVALADTAKTAAANIQSQPVNTLGGKFGFTLPPGYAQSALPQASGKAPGAGAKGTMYMNQAQRRVVVVTEVPIPNGVTTGDNDDEFLSGASEGFVKQQGQALPDFKKTGQRRFTLGKLGVEQIDSTASMGGGPTLSSTFLAGSGNTMSLVQVISRANDKAGHDALVKSISLQP